MRSLFRHCCTAFVRHLAEISGALLGRRMGMGTEVWRAIPGRLNIHPELDLWQRSHSTSGWLPAKLQLSPARHHRDHHTPTFTFPA